MKSIGIVERINDDNTCTVSVARVSMCGENCGACKGGCKPTDKVVSANINGCDVRVGDRVILNTETKEVMAAAFLVYILPILALILGYAIGTMIFDKEIFVIFFAICFLVFFFLIVKFAEKNVKKHKKCQISIYKVLH